MPSSARAAPALELLLLLLLLEQALGGAPAAEPIPCAHHAELRPRYHFLPADGWMNDPNGVFQDPKTGVYHLFYQANINATCNQNPWGRGVDQSWGPRWSGMRWGHAVSNDLLAWTRLPVAINHWDGAYYDCPPWPAIFSGSTTLDEAGHPLVFYSVPCQTWVNGAVPANRSDKLLVDWAKLGPIFNASESVTKGSGDDGKGKDWGTTFRDPTTAWRAGGHWWTAMACMNGTCLSKAPATAGRGLRDAQWTSAGWFHLVPNSGTWECPDVFELPGGPSNQSRFVLKANTAQGSACKGPGPNNWWVLGDFSAEAAGTRAGAFAPSSTEICGAGFDGIGNHFDFSGLFYASKSFRTVSGSQVLVVWVKEGDALGQGLNVSWAGVLSIPRTIRLQLAPTEMLLTYPIAAVESLRGEGVPIADFGDHGVAPALQFDLDARLPLLSAAAARGATEDDFTISLVAAKSEKPEDLHGGVADPLLEMQIHVNSTGGGVLRVNGDRAPFTVPAGKTALAVRVLMDRSIFEVFVAGGQVAYTGRVYSPATAAVAVSIRRGLDMSGVSAAPVAADAPIATLYPMADPAPDVELESLAAEAWAASEARPLKTDDSYSSALDRAAAVPHIAKVLDRSRRPGAAAADARWTSRGTAWKNAWHSNSEQ